MGMILLRNVDVHAPHHLGLRHVLVGGGHILWMGDGEAPSLPNGADNETIDLAGRRLIPGLIDGHVHVTGGGGEAGFRSRVPPLGLSRFTQAGITTVVGLLGTDDCARGTRELLARVYGLREEGLSAYAYCGGYHVPPATVTGSVRDDLMFIEALVGVGEVAISDHRSSQPTCAELLRLGADAHVAGLLTGKAGFIHLHLGDGLRGLELVRQALHESELPPRVFQPTHVNRRRALFDEALDLARHGSPIDITAFPVTEDEDAWSAPDALLRALEAGVPPDRLTVSSDAGGSLPCFDARGELTRMDVAESGALLAALQELVKRGLRLEKALPAFTTNPAVQLRLRGKGRIATGADADLVALDENNQPHLVMARGVVHVRDDSLVQRGWFEHDPAR